MYSNIHPLPNHSEVIDGGQYFVSTYVFPDLPVGPYNVVVLDASGICAFEMDAPIEVGGNVDVEDPNEDFANRVKLYPNPTDNNFNVEIDSFSHETVTIEVYDGLGRIIQTGSIAKDDSRKTTISLDGYGSGAYLVRCYTNLYKKSFKVIKL